VKRTRALKTLSLILLLAACATTMYAQRSAPPTKAELAEITERGRDLAAYDAAAWQGTDAVVALKPKEGSVARYIARRTPSGWRVAFGRFSEKQDSFLVAYEAVQGAGANDYTAKHYESPLVVKDFYFFAARAIDTALADFKGEQRPYNVAVLPAKAEQLWVYLVPAQTQAGIFPLGGDVRYLISKDGAKIVERRQLHNSIIEFSKPPDLKEVATSFHTAVLDDVPEDTDVFHVLARTPRVPELIASKKYMYQIAVDGTITFIGKTEDIMGIGKKPPPR
jgi:hypothetical protein